MIFLASITILELFQGEIKESENLTLKGFLIESASHEYFLSDTPNVPSCCAGKGKQIRVIGEGLTPSRKPQELTGELRLIQSTWTLVLPPKSA